VRALASHLPGRNAVLWPGESIDYRDLVAVADALVITPPLDVSATSIAWAMAASCPIIGSAVYSVAEFIAHKHNGYLIKPDRSQRMTFKIAAAVERVRDMTKEKETARGQAYEVFSVRRFVDQFVQISRNVLNGSPAAADIRDPAAA
jgi:glycosyltransferase involved in cell wall biosynthesis